MYNFSNHLLEGEKILYQGQPVPGKGSKSVGGSLLLICMGLIVGIGSLVSIVFFLVAALFLGLGVYVLVYNLILKQKRIADDFYCLTNMRVMKYESKKNKLVFGYLAYYDEIRCNNVKDNFGDLYMGMVINESSFLKTIEYTKKSLTDPDPENMPSITFESIESPYKVEKLVCTAKEELLRKVDSQNSNNVSNV